MTDGNNKDQLQPEEIIERLQGKWYEQRVNGAVITIEKDRIVYDEGEEHTSGSFDVRNNEEGYNEWDIITHKGFKAKWSPITL